MSAPSSKPEQPKSDSWLKQFWRDHQAVATIISAIMGAIVVITVAAVFRPIVNVFAGPPPSPTTTPPATPVPPPNPTTTSPDPTPTVGVHRSTGDPLRLSGGYSIDLDSMKADWDVNAEDKEGWDLKFRGLGSVGLAVNRHNSDLAVVTGNPTYETCEGATDYSEGLYPEQLKEGLKACVKTSEKRFAVIKIRKLIGDREKIELDVTVWDPPYE